MDFINSYISSFKLKSMFLSTLAVDALTWLLIGGMFYWLGSLLKNRLSVVTGGMAPEAFQQYVLSLNAEQAQLVAAQIKTIVIQLSLFVVVLPILALLLYSLSRAILWNMLLGKDFTFRQHWKWNLLHIVLIFIAVCLFLLYLVVQTVIDAFVPLQAISSVLGFMLVVGFVVLMFLSSNHFTHTRKVFESVVSGFKALKRKDFYVAWAFGIATIFILRFVQYPFRSQLFIYQGAALVVGAVLVLLWLSWFRMYVVNVVHDT